MPSGKRLSWYLAAEEYFAKNVTEEIIFFWKVRPTVIFGRHQVMENEVNLSYCRAHHIDLVRRKSGGGCVYADEGNLMTSYLSPSTHSEQVFQHYLQLMAGALQQLGIPAVTTEHNDILIHHPQSTIATQVAHHSPLGAPDTKHKISGNACYTLPTGTIVHGTMLFNVDFDALQQAITPDHEKLAKHGVESVRQRVANLVEVTHAWKDIEELQKALSQLLCDQCVPLPKEAINQINEIEKTYDIY